MAMSWLIVGIVCVQAVAWITACGYLLFKGVANLLASSSSLDPRVYKSGVFLLGTATVVFLFPPVIILAVKKCRRSTKLPNVQFRPVPQEDPPPSYEEVMANSPKRY